MEASDCTVENAGIECMMNIKFLQLQRKPSVIYLKPEYYKKYLASRSWYGKPKAEYFGIPVVESLEESFV